MLLATILGRCRRRCQRPHQRGCRRPHQRWYRRRCRRRHRNRRGGRRGSRRRRRRGRRRGSRRGRRRGSRRLFRLSCPHRCRLPLLIMRTLGLAAQARAALSWAWTSPALVAPLRMPGLLLLHLRLRNICGLRYRTPLLRARGSAIRRGSQFLTQTGIQESRTIVIMVKTVHYFITIWLVFGMTAYAPTLLIASALDRGADGDRGRPFTPLYNDQWMARYRRG